MFAVLFYLLAAIMASHALPDVHRGVMKKLESGKGQGAFLVTFKGANLDSAYDKEKMFSMVTDDVDVHVQMVKFNQFVASGEYHHVRGDYVHKTITEHHRNTKRMLKGLVPNVRVASTIPISNSFLLVATKKEIEKLSQSELVTEIHTNDAFHIHLPMSAVERGMKSDTPLPYESIIEAPAKFHRFLKQNSAAGTQWNIEKIGADKVWAMDSKHSRGQGIRYAIADTGVDYMHSNIKGNYLGMQEDGSFDHNYCWYDGVRRKVAVDGPIKCAFQSPAPCDDQGHGTHVTSTAVGANGFGVAPGAKWMACRNMDRGVGSPETYLNCLNFFLAPHDLEGRNADPSKRPHVVGNSYGCPDSEGCSKHAMNSAVETLRAAGIFMSVSAGNEGPKCSSIQDPPAIEKNVVSVAATDLNDKLADFSSRGPCVVKGEAYRKPDVAAPGVRVLAAYPGNAFRALSGTSMASPHVGGAVALILAMCPCLMRDVDALQALLEETAVKLVPPPSERPLCGNDKPDSVPNNYFGHGRIDVLAAVRKCQRLCKEGYKQ